VRASLYPTFNNRPHPRPAQGRIQISPFGPGHIALKNFGGGGHCLFQYTRHFIPAKPQSQWGAGQTRKNAPDGARFLFCFKTMPDVSADKGAGDKQNRTDGGADIRVLFPLGHAGAAGQYGRCQKDCG